MRSLLIYYGSVFLTLQQTTWLHPEQGWSQMDERQTGVSSIRMRKKNDPDNSPVIWCRPNLDRKFQKQNELGNKTDSNE